MASNVADTLMDPQATEPSDDRVLILAPLGRDALLTAEVLRRSDIATHICATMSEFCRTLEEGAGAGIISEEALTPESVSELIRILDRQPPWSDFPCVVLLNGGEPTRRTVRVLELLKPIGSLTVLEKPVRVTTLLSAARASLRGRARQYQMRDYLIEQKRAEEALERSNEDLERFAYAASHDLKEPLRLIGSYVQLLQRKYGGQLGPEADEYIQYVVSSVHRMDELIAALLTYSRVGTRDHALEPVDCEAVLKWTFMNLQMAIQESGAAITHDPLPTLLADQSHVLQLFQNLLSNAINYRSAEPPRIHVSAAIDGEFWRFSFRDNGVGIDPKYYKQIFGVFKRLHGRDRPGTGIGLAVCQRIVERRGGTIWVESELGKGSTFYFTLPAN